MARRAKPVPPADDTETGDRRVWNISVPLITNPLFLGATVKVFALAGLMMWALLGFVFAMQGEWEQVGTFGLFTGAIVGGLLVIVVPLAVLLLRNRLDFRFTLDAGGLTCERVDKRARTIDRLTVLLGLLAGKPGAVGTGLISSSMATTRVGWSSVRRVRPWPSMHAIALANVWRTTVVVYCPPGRYEAILAEIEARVAATTTSRRANPVPRLLLRTALVVLASVPLFNLPEEIDLFAPLFVLCFALAAVWLIPLLAWAVLGGLVYIAVDEWVALNEPFRSLLDGSLIRPIELFFGDDWVLTGFAGAGAGYLVFLSWSLLTGRIESGLAADIVEMDDG